MSFLRSLEYIGPVAPGAIGITALSSEVGASNSRGTSKSFKIHGYEIAGVHLHILKNAHMGLLSRTSSPVRFA